jgi:hypothetical protein
MIDFINNNFECKLAKELTNTDLKYYFDFKSKKFLQAIDTFYYTVTLNDDFTLLGKDACNNVSSFRRFIKERITNKNIMYENVIPLDLKGLDSKLTIRPFRFAGVYDAMITNPELFDIIIACQTPNIETGQILVQLRSYFLWTVGVHNAIDKSLEVVEELCKQFGLSIKTVQENRVDYCWHTNYLTSPEKFLNPENFAKMRVSTLTEGMIHVNYVGDEDYELDYITLGKKSSNKLFFRIYLKSKEVVEMGYKAFFLKLWLFNGLINRYDLYCYEECYLRRNWRYLDYARLKFYYDYGSDENEKIYIKQILDEVIKPSIDDIKDLANRLTPKVNLIINVEYQTMRKFSKSVQLIDFPNLKIDKEYKRRVFNYLNNSAAICDYLTHTTVRLVKTSADSQDKNKARRDINGFWKSLRNTVWYAPKLSNNELKIVRIYNTKLNAQFVKNRMLSDIGTYALYLKGDNEDDSRVDVVDVLSMLNDNDMHRLFLHKQKTLKRLNNDELVAVSDTVDFENNYHFVDNATGEMFSNSVKMKRGD